ncbi:hypothetical protein EIKCOROL_00908 [Eikenella corrodens ATCC 23834]|uniref:Uncharacterized protein n=1 Tax=Eikenella corrodens ATCC 23834 TaxID=546274 RepID=C0DU77_EIKCO|nr:hypothetical protein EIKCOROL_00908 [Eikenella corrodens ATCC 23834]
MAIIPANSQKHAKTLHPVSDNRQFYMKIQVFLYLSRHLYLQ